MLEKILETVEIIAMIASFVAFTVLLCLLVFYGVSFVVFGSP